MRVISSAFAAHIADEVTTVAICWRVRRRDGIALGFTTHDRPLDIDGLNYRAATGFTPTAIDSSSALDVDNLDIEGILRSGAISRADLLEGRYDFAEISISLVNWADLSQGRVLLRLGWIGEVAVTDAGFTAELRGLTQLLQGPVGEVYSPECRADHGDARCKLNLEAFTAMGTVTAASDRQSFTDAGRGEADGWFDYGLLVWLSGANAGLEMEVKAYGSGQFSLFLPMPRAILAGDRYRVTAGCDKRFQTCRDKFGNVTNFRGEPFVPGQDSVLDYPGVG